MYRPTYHYVWDLNVVKATEGGLGTTTALSALKGMKGIAASSHPSSFMGHSRLCVRAVGVKSMRQALKVLKGYGYVHTVKEEMMLAIYSDEGHYA